MSDESFPNIEYTSQLENLATILGIETSTLKVESTRTLTPFYTINDIGFIQPFEDLGNLPKFRSASVDELVAEFGDIVAIHTEPKSGRKIVVGILKDPKDKSLGFQTNEILAGHLNNWHILRGQTYLAEFGRFFNSQIAGIDPVEISSSFAPTELRYGDRFETWVMRNIFEASKPLFDIIFPIFDTSDRTDLILDRYTYSGSQKQLLTENKNIFTRIIGSMAESLSTKYGEKDAYNLLKLTKDEIYNLFAKKFAIGLNGSIGESANQLKFNKNLTLDDKGRIHYDNTEREEAIDPYNSSLRFEGSNLVPPAYFHKKISGLENPHLQRIGGHCPVLHPHNNEAEFPTAFHWFSKYCSLIFEKMKKEVERIPGSDDEF